MSEGLNVKVKIDLNRIRRNLQDIRRELNGAKLMLILKADAYGHGLEEVASATADVVDGFGVITMNEAVRIRKISRDTPVLVNMPLADEIETAVNNNLTIGVSNDEQLSKILSLAKADDGFKRSVKIHLKADSGMHRFGFDAGEIYRVCRALKDAGLNADGVYSHFGDHPETQIGRFEDVCRLVREYFPNAMRHIASTHTFKKFAFDGVRIGLSGYIGAMSVESEVLASRRVNAGEYIGYGDFTASKPMNIAVVFGGYADGVPVRLRTVKVGCRECRVINVCMDSTIIDTGKLLLYPRDVVTILDGNALEKTAKKIKTIPYVLLTTWKGRINKIYC